MFDGLYEVSRKSKPIPRIHGFTGEKCKSRVRGTSERHRGMATNAVLSVERKGLNSRAKDILCAGEGGVFSPVLIHCNLSYVFHCCT